MKRRMKAILCFLTAVMLMGIPAGAEEENMHLSWRGDYQTNELVVSVQSAADYIQQVTVVMYPADIAEPKFSDYCRIGEVTVQGGKKAEIRFKISDRLDAADGAYILRVQGNGYQAAQSRAAEEVWVLRPSDIADENGEGLLKQINAAAADQVKPYIDRVSKALLLTVAENESAARLEDFIRVKNDSYGGSFQTVSEVAAAWKISDVIAYLAQDSPDAKVLETKMDGIADILSAEREDEIYQTYREDIYKNMISIRKTYRGGIGVQNRSDIETVFEKARVLAVINGSAEDALENHLTTYYRALGISTETYQKFASFGGSDKQKALRQIYHKNFADTDAVCKTFETAVNQIAERNASGGNTLPSGGSGGSGGSGVSGGGRGYEDGYAIREETNDTPKPDIAFADCGTSHWAYPYVNEMKTDGIISGYDDGNFYPDQQVKREEFVKMAVMASGLYEKDAACDFEDVPQDAWYYGYIASAHHANVINGVGEKTFGIGQEMKREDVAVIVCRILNMFQVPEENRDALTDAEKDFTDGADIDDYAKDSVAVLAEMKILRGFEDGSFRPQDCLTRAEAAKILSVVRGYIRK